MRNDTVKSKKLMLIRNIIILVFSLIFLVGGCTCLYADQLLNKIKYTPDIGSSQVGPALQFNAGNGSSSNTNAKAGIIGGMYHDDAIINILMLGTDDYQKDDVGRSDSMLLVSIDTRHNKLKITSFMRDLYVAIPGIGSNKLNAAYSLAGGREKGARKVVTTLEANFGIDIDRYVIVDFSAFPKIIDRLGGVEINLTNETNSDGITEAGIINAYSGDSKQVHTGLNNLDGLQARYYTRIREIGNDFERTERQRKVFTSLVKKLKSASLPTIYGVLADTLNDITTNMTKDEIVSMASNSLTYLHYPVAQDRVPRDGEYTPKTLDVGACLVPNLTKSRDSFTKFIFENDIPTGTYTP
jgi:LCP family protein required for cell wall assembly